MTAAEGVGAAAFIAAAATTGAAAALDALISTAATDRDAVADMVREAALVKRPKNCRSNRIGIQLLVCESGNL